MNKSVFSAVLLGLIAVGLLSSAAAQMPDRNQTSNNSMQMQEFQEQQQEMHQMMQDMLDRMQRMMQRMEDMRENQRPG